jgi:hypothetical protein
MNSSNGPGVEHRLRVAGQLDVGQQFDGMAVERDGRRMAKSIEPGPFELDLALAETVFLEHDR